MPTRTSLEELRRFWKDPIWEGAYVEDLTLRIGGKDYDDLDPEDAKFAPELEVVFVSEGSLQDHPTEVSLEDLFKKWRKLQSTTAFTVNVPKTKIGDFTAFLKSIDATIVGGK